MSDQVHSVGESSWVPLLHMKNGKKATVQKLSGQATVCHRLREMGFCELAEVKVVSNSGSMICMVCGCKVCLSQQLASSIMVTPSSS